MIVVSACRRIVVKTVQARVCRIRDVGVRDDQRRTRITGKSERRGRTLEEKMMRSGSRMITEKTSRKGSEKDRRGIINEGAGPRQGDFGGCGRL